MAGFANNAAIVTAINSGQTGYIPFRKVSSNVGNSTAANWLNWFAGTGTPTNFPYGGVSGTATVLDSSTVGAMPISEGNVSPLKRYLKSISLFSSTANISMFILCDFLLYYPTFTAGGSIDNTATLTRYSDGKDVVMVFSEIPSTGGSIQIQPTYTAPDDLDYAFTSESIFSTDSGGTNRASLAGVSYDGGLNFVRFPFAPIPLGTTAPVGVKKIVSYSNPSSTDTAAFLVKPLAVIPFGSTSFYSEVSFLDSLNFIEILDGACLGFISLSSGTVGTSSVITGEIKYVWG